MWRYQLNRTEPTPTINPIIQSPDLNYSGKLINYHIKNFQELNLGVGLFLFLGYWINFLETESLDSLSM